ncbi:MAG TPA: magnesium/cobalt transporter CorA [Plasticicumulans sp.]|uniref:magnesium/cobalt transporter CorA n=1 Tax=Plasticicumulans sp. TaxID=2307179 RepID=UPI000FAA2C1C|nr:magnesium/cobalt transporter CorA [Plasticicumulans sp.]MBS0600446.1 magnesium/cobalt transporter CorA [Pseudomonadota bacterium]RTK99313.1 MAG: magnesium/cobalt transporter CorA [Xanthomonadales bacterium]HMV38016.1 magnesium/cobalt transporter CorA [Plasticicumulans sp.]HMW29188.1 magnesium/cobalt transporter CorA [Plasticicumulans sp.]HMW41426.1 magnesium/cobalt transporter CorA [Plasticicumulans sp.]
MTPAKEECAGIVICAAYADGRRIGDIKLDDIPQMLRRDGAFVWLGLYEPDEALMQRVQQCFDLHDLAVEDAHKAHQRPKMEAYGDSLFIVLRTARWDDSAETAAYGETHVFLGHNYLVSVRHGASQTYRPARLASERQPQLLAHGPSFALYALMDFVVDNYFPVLSAYEDRLDELEADIFSGGADRDSTEEIYRLKRELVTLRRASLPLVDVCSDLMSLRVALVPDSIRPYFRDVLDHLKRINDTLDTMREMLATVLQVSLALASVRQNEVTKALAGWAAILAVPTVVFGLYGMNFDKMPELHWHYGYPAIVVATFLVCVWLYLRLKRTGWL